MESKKPLLIEESNSNIEMSVHATNEIEESIDNACVIRIQKLLKDNRREGTQSITEKDSTSICRVPQNLATISSRATEPEMVSIGPYHRDRDQVREFQSYKWQFLDSLLSRVEQAQSVPLHLARTFKESEHPARRERQIVDLTQAMKELEYRARREYSEPIDMSSDDFIEMMLLDGCFIIELFRQVHRSIDSANAESLVFMKPWIIPILIGDLVKLENQLPSFVLLDLYVYSVGNFTGPLGDHGKDFGFQALEFFSLVLPRLKELLKEQLDREDFSSTKHLLHLFYSSYRLPKISAPYSMCRPLTNESIPCVTRLRHAGVKFRSKKDTDGNFLRINFHKGVLAIPPVTINDFTSTILINCAAFEQCYPQPTFTYVSEYIAFMSCLINSSRDVTFLCDDGIISKFSYNDQYVANLFTNLGKNVVVNIRDCHLSNEFREVEAYYSSNWPTLRRTYFSSPWSTISVISASVLLALTAIQTITAILSYKGPP